METVFSMVCGFIAAITVQIYENKNGLPRSMWRPVVYGGLWGGAWFITSLIALQHIIKNH